MDRWCTAGGLGGTTVGLDGTAGGASRKSDGLQWPAVKRAQSGRERKHGSHQSGDLAAAGRTADDGR